MPVSIRPTSSRSPITAGKQGLAGRVVTGIEGSASVYFRAWLPGEGLAWNTGSMIGPHGEKRPADPLANALHVARLSTGEAEETYVDRAKQAGGRKGGEARAKALTPTERRLIAQRAAKARHHPA